MSSLIYQSPSLYSLVMRVLYWGHFSDRYEAVARLIPDRAEVVEVCAGDCFLYTHFLSRRSVRYLGLDIAPNMLAQGNRNGAKTRLFDLWKEEIPLADYVIIQGSLCQFIPHAEKVLSKLIHAARKKLIVAEPVRNWSTSKNPLLSFLGKKFTQPVGDSAEYAAQRFDERSLRGLFEQFSELESSFEIPGGREIIGVFRGKA